MSSLHSSPAVAINVVAAASGPARLQRNRRIDDALRRAYRKYDRSKQTRLLLRRHLVAQGRHNAASYACS